MKPRREPDRDRIELLQGTLDLLILATSQWVLQVETGSLYSALHRMEKRGWIASEWKQTESNQRARFYRLTAAGRKQVAAEQFRWRQFACAMASAMSPGLKASES